MIKRRKIAPQMAPHDWPIELTFQLFVAEGERSPLATSIAPPLPKRAHDPTEPPESR